MIIIIIILSHYYCVINKITAYGTRWNRVLRRVSGPERDKVTGDWRELHNEELNICTPHHILFG